MYCPFCNHLETKVIDSRLAGEGRQIRRRRECLSCGERFTTFEAAELIMPMVVKSDRTREPFDEAKLRAGMTKALEKRPVALEAVEEAVSRIGHKLRSMGEREVQSRTIGELVMDELRHLDEVAYVRFASVYRSFQDLDAFRDEIDRLRHRRGRRDAGRDVAAVDQLPLLSHRTAATKGPQVSEFDAADHAFMARALALAAQGPGQRASESARGLRAGARRGGAGRGLARSVPAARTPRRRRSPICARRRSRRHGLRDPRAVQSSWPHAALQRGADQGRRGARGLRGRRPESAGQRRRRPAAARGRRAGAVGPARRPRRSNSMPGSSSACAQGVPLVRVKLAMSLDGRTALSDGRSQWITGEAARQRCAALARPQFGRSHRHRHGAGR